MSYQPRIDPTPVYEFPYSGPQANTIPLYNVDINLLLSNIAPPLGDPFYNQAPIITFQQSPQINPSVDNNAVIYQVPENVPIETILRQFGIDTRTLQPSNIVDNYYRSVSQPMDITVHTATNRRRRFVCRELSDSEDDNDRRPPAQNRRQHYNTWSNRSKQSPGAVHDLLSKVWNKAERASERLPPSSSAPNLNWQPMRNTPPPSPPPPPPSNFGVNNAWQAMRNAPPPISPDHRNAVNNVWNRADYATQQKANRLSNVFNRMRQPAGGIIHEPPLPQNREALNNFYAARNLPPGINQPPPPQNREALNNFYAARNLPPGINQPPPPQNREALNNFYAARNLPPGINQPPLPQNREALNNFYAARNLPPGINQPPLPQNREALNNFYAARNLPPGINQPPPPQNREALNNFYAARNLPPGINQPPPPQNREALNNFYAARNIPPGINQPNPAISNVWNRAYQAPPSPPTNYAWNRMQQGASIPPNSSFPYPPYGVPSRAPSNVPAPASFGALLAQAHRQQSAYAGAA